MPPWISGMERLDPAAQDLGLAGVVRDLGDLEPGRGQGRARAAAGQQVDPRGARALRELEQAAFVGDAQQGPADGDDVGSGL